MASLLSWVDYSSAHRDDMDRLLDAFRDKGTVDEIGIGTIRDAFSDLLFPGTSTLHTRARYLLFVPWAVTATTAQRHRGERAGQELRNLEVSLIKALRKGDLDGGIIGRDAGGSLKRLPSTVYWSAISRYGIKRCGHSAEQHLRFAGQQAEKVRDEDAADPVIQLDPCFRQLPPPPGEWLQEADFELTRPEAEFLRERILSTCDGHYIAWLVDHGIPGDPQMPWDTTLADSLPVQLARTVERARLFSCLLAGAPILYNLLLARRKGWDEGIDEYENHLAAWQDNDEVRSSLPAWDNHELWTLLANARWRSRTSTRSFVEEWVRHVQSGIPLATNSGAHRLVEYRERQLKGARSRFINPDSLESWQGGNGMGRLTYRWPEVKTLVGDIRRGLEAPVA